MITNDHQHPGSMRTRTTIASVSQSKATCAQSHQRDRARRRCSWSSVAAVALHGRPVSGVAGHAIGSTLHRDCIWLTGPLRVGGPETLRPASATKSAAFAPARTIVFVISTARNEQVAWRQTGRPAPPRPQTMLRWRSARSSPFGVDAGFCLQRLPRSRRRGRRLLHSWWGGWARSRAPSQRGRENLRPVATAVCFAFAPSDPSRS